MGLALEFLEAFWMMLGLTWPLLLSLMALISLIGLFIGRIEGLSLIDAQYFAFVTATTVGYGDHTPKHKRTKLAAIMIAFIGILLTGIIVAAGIKALELSAERYYVSKPLPAVLEKLQ